VFEGKATRCRGKKRFDWCDEIRPLTGLEGLARLMRAKSHHSLRAAAQPHYFRIFRWNPPAQIIRQRRVNPIAPNA
jgi:hypothetical protein